MRKVNYAEQQPFQHARGNKMGVQPVGRLLAGMAVPMMISMLVQALYNVVVQHFSSPGSVRTL